MLTPNEVYYLYRGGNWETAGDDIQYKFHLDDKEHIIYVVYQCSQSKRDWQNNLNFFTKPIYLESKKIKCHRGFLDAFMSAKETIFKSLDSYKTEHPNYSVIFTGHSFGGAMSQLSGIYYYREYGVKADIITFGSPKVIRQKKDLKLVKDLCFNSFTCWANHNDFVSYMPPHFTRLGCNRVGDRFNLFSLLFKGDHYHTNYGEIDYTKY